MSRALRLGLLGTGVAANKLYLPALLKLKGKVEVVACCNRRRSKAAAFSEQLGGVQVVNTIEELLALPNVEAVLISLPIEVQPQFVRLALAAGKPVLSEKPVAPSLAEAGKLLRAAKKLGTPWLVGENYAFMSQVRQAQRWIQSGRLGQVRFVEVRQVTWMDKKNPYFHTPWRQSPKHLGGFVVDGGVHLANVVRRCFGMPTAIKALTAQFDPNLPPVDTVVAALRFESGALGTWTSCFSARHTGPMLRAYGSRANLTLSHTGAELTDKNGKVTHAPNNDSFVAELLHFSDVVRKGKPPEVSAEEALEDLRLIDALLRVR